MGFCYSFVELVWGIEMALGRSDWCYCYIIMQLVRVTCLFTGHYNTDLHGTFTDVILSLFE